MLGIINKIRNNENNNVLFKNIIGSVIIRGLGLVISFFTLPAYIRFFSNDVSLGLWFSLLSIISWVLTFDFGIGNGLRNNLVSTYITGDVEKQKTLISTAYIVIGIISLVFLLICSVSSFAINWNKLLNVNVSIISSKTIKLSVFIVALSIVLQFFLKLIVNILDSMRKNVFSSSLILMTTIINLLYVLLFKSESDEIKLINLSVVYLLSSTLPYLISTLIIFKNKLKLSRPNFKYYDKKHLSSIMSLGVSFFFIQLALLIIINTDQFLISNIFGADKVVTYQIYHKLFFLIVSIFSLIASPIWSGITNAYEKKDFLWIKRIYKFMNIISIICLLALVILAVILQFVFNVWLRDETINVNYNYVFPFLIFSFSMIYLYAMTSIANGIGKLKSQMICNGIGAIIKIPIVYIVSIYVKDWIVIVYVNALIFMTSSIIQSIILNIYIVKKTKYNH